MDNELKKNGTAIHWFRYDLRLHDMPSLNATLKVSSFYFVSRKKNKK